MSILLRNSSLSQIQLGKNLIRPFGNSLFRMEGSGSHHSHHGSHGHHPHSPAHHHHNNHHQDHNSHNSDNHHFHLNEHHHHHLPGPNESLHKQAMDVDTETAGVFRYSETDDIKVLVDNFTAPALAMALRNRESTLQSAAILAHNGDLERVKKILQPFLRVNVEKRRIRNHGLDISHGFTRNELVIIQRYLHRMPRHIYQAAESRASVIIPLCNVSGVASVLFERRSSKVRTHKQQVCFPGGMLDEGIDATIVQTSLREIEEELGIPKEKIEVLGVLRCNWNEVASMTGIAVTPVVGFIGEVNDLKLTPNSDEVEQYFTVPLDDIFDENKWVTRNFSTPMFTGGPYAIWGLTAYLLERFLKDVLLKCHH